MSIQKTQVLHILSQGQIRQAFKNAAAEPGSRNLALTATLFYYVSREAETKRLSHIATNQRVSVTGDLCLETLPCWRKIVSQFLGQYLAHTIWHIPEMHYFTNRSFY